MRIRPDFCLNWLPREAHGWLWLLCHAGGWVWLGVRSSSGAIPYPTGCLRGQGEWGLTADIGGEQRWVFAPYLLCLSPCPESANLCQPTINTSRRSLATSNMSSEDTPKKADRCAQPTA